MLRVAKRRNCLINAYRTMSGAHLVSYSQQRRASRSAIKDVSLATPEEFVKKFDGDRVITKVCIIKLCCLMIDVVS